MPQVTNRDVILEKILEYCRIPRKKSEIAEYCGFKGSKNFTKNYLGPLLEAGKISMTIPERRLMFRWCMSTVSAVWSICPERWGK